VLVIREDLRSELISNDECGNSNEVVGADKLILESVLTDVVEISLDDVINGKVDDDGDRLGEELVVGVSFSSNTDSLERFPTWTIVVMLNKKTKMVVRNVVVDID